MAAIKTWLVCFDVSDDRRRRQVVKLLLAHGLRVQKSVFEVCTSGDEQLQVLQSRLLAAVDESDDVRFYRLCADCRRGSIRLGNGEIARFPLAVVL